MATRTISSHYEASSSDQCCNDCSVCCSYPSGMGALASLILSLLVASLSTAVCASCSFARVQVDIAGTFATSGASDDFMGDWWSDTDLFADSTIETTDDFWGDFSTDFFGAFLTLLITGVVISMDCLATMSSLGQLHIILVSFREKC